MKTDWHRATTAVTRRTANQTFAPVALVCTWSRWILRFDRSEKSKEQQQREDEELHFGFLKKYLSMLAGKKKKRSRIINCVCDDSEALRRISFPVIHAASTTRDETGYACRIIRNEF